MVQRVLFGDNTAAISVLSLPDGPWRTRRLRLRSAGLCEKLTKKSTWALGHVPGSLLVADFLPKAINPKPRWNHFMRFLKVWFDEGQGCSEEPSTPVDDQKVSTPVDHDGKERVVDEKRELTKVAVAGLCAVAVLKLHLPKGSPEQKKKLQVLKEIYDFVEEKVTLIKAVRVKRAPPLTGTVGAPAVKVLKAPLPGVDVVAASSELCEQARALASTW